MQQPFGFGAEFGFSTTIPSQQAVNQQQHQQNFPNQFMTMQNGMVNQPQQQQQQPQNAFNHFDPFNQQQGFSQPQQSFDQGFGMMQQQKPQQQQNAAQFQNQMPMDHQFGNMGFPQQQQQQQQPMMTFEMPKPQKLRVKLENSERGVYSALYTQVDPEESNSIKSDKAVEFFNRSGLSKQVLRQIWMISVPEGDKMDKDAFYVALRLIAYAQNNIDVSDSSIMQNIKAPSNPKFAPKTSAQQQPQNLNEGTSSDFMQNNNNNNINNNRGSIGGGSMPGQPSGSPFEITVDFYQKYEKYFEVTDAQKTGQVTGMQAKQIFTKSQLPNDVLKLIWMLTDVEKKGFLNKFQFIVMVHLVSLAKKEITIPKQLPQELSLFISSAGKSVLQAQPLLAPAIDMNKPSATLSVAQAFNNISPQQASPQPPSTAATVSSQNIGNWDNTAFQEVQPQNNNGFSQQQGFQTNMQQQQQQPSGFSTSFMPIVPPTQPSASTLDMQNLPGSQTQNNQLPPQVNAQPASSNSLINDIYSAFANMEIAPSEPIIPPTQVPQKQNQPAVQSFDMGGFGQKNDPADFNRPIQPVQMSNPLSGGFTNPSAGGFANISPDLKDVETKLLDEQQKLKYNFEENRMVQNSFIEQSNEQLSVIYQIIEAYTKTNKKFADENEVFKSEVKKLYEKQTEAIQQLTDIGRNFHANLVANKALRAEVINVATESIQNITQHAQQIIGGANQQSNYDAQGFQNNYDAQSQQQYQQHNGFGQQGFDISNQFNNNEQQNAEQSNWGAQFEATNYNNDNQQVHQDNHW